MIRTVLKIDGMMCSMCEAHVNDILRKSFSTEKVSSSASKGESIVISKEPIDIDKAKSVIKETGYEVLSAVSEPCEKKSLFGKLFH